MCHVVIDAKCDVDVECSNECIERCLSQNLIAAYCD